MNGAPIRLAVSFSMCSDHCLACVLVIGLFCLSSEVRPYFLTGANFKIISSLKQ